MINLLFNIPTRVECYYDKYIILNQPLFQYIKRPQTDKIIYVSALIIYCTSDILFTLNIIVYTAVSVHHRIYRSPKETYYIVLRNETTIETYLFNVLCNSI